MNEITLQAVVGEIAPTLESQKFGRIFPLSRVDLAIDFRLFDGKYLFISIDPREPRLHLIKRRLKDLEKQSINPHPFLLLLRKRLSNSIVEEITKDENERIVRFRLAADDELEGPRTYTLVVQLTGRSANLFLLDENDFVIDSLRENEGAGQTVATRFAPPARSGEGRGRDTDELFDRGRFGTLSEALDEHYQNLEVERQFQAKAKAAAAKLRQEIAKREKLRKKIEQDLANHGEAEKWKRLGDLLLANLANAARIDQTVLVTDYFDENAPTIEIEVAENLSLTEAAEKFFKRYTKARNAQQELQKRLEVIAAELTGLERQNAELEKAVAEKDLSDFGGNAPEKKAAKGREKRDDSFRGARRYISSDGIEILVGKASKDNDHLTFRIAKSLDFWLHAADYGGSHVVVRNPNRAADMPPKTLLEAAQLAAYFSQAKAQPKVAVNYTQKKFVNKPKGAAPGLVSLSAFKTILVEPQESLEKVSGER